MKKAAVLLKKNIEFPIMILVYVIFTVLHNFGIINSYIMQVAMLADTIKTAAFCRALTKTSRRRE